jgi:hypothetical protein
MPNTTSASLKLTVQATGENSGTWGQITNTNLLILEQAIGGYAGVALNATTGATLTFSNGALSDGKNQVLKLTGTITTNVDVIVPDSIEKTYVVENATSGAFTVTVKTTSGTGVTWGTTDKGKKLIYSDGTNILEGISSIDTLKVSTFTSTGIDDNATSTAITIDSSENVGIGTASPNNYAGYGNITLNGTSGGIFDLGVNGTRTGTLLALVTETRLSSITNIPLTFSTNNAERMRIDSSGNVGIGTTAPDALLSVNGVASFGDGTALLPSIANFGDLNTGMWFPAADTIAFSEGGAEAMRITSDGRLGIGTTTPVTPLQVNRDISGVTDALALRANSNVVNEYIGLQFGKATWGRMSGIYGKNENTGNADGRLGFYTSSGGTYAERLGITSTGLIFPGSDNTQDLGSSGSRFKDLYLGGGLYVGGTAAANELDDYEEGTWTPVALFANDTSSNQAGTYTKIGNVVTACFTITFSATSFGVPQGFSTLPFASANVTGNNAGVSIGLYTGAAAPSNTLTGNLLKNTTQIALNDASGVVTSDTRIRSANFNGVVVYRTA